jgi:hypothetical protein
VLLTVKPAARTGCATNKNGESMATNAMIAINRRERKNAVDDIASPFIGIIIEPRESHKSGVIPSIASLISDKPNQRKTVITM